MLDNSKPVIVSLILFASAVSTQSASPQTKTDELFRLVTTIGSHKEKTASISFGDIDGDGDQDMVVANGRHWPGQNRVFINDGKGGFAVERKLSDEQDTTYAVPLADLDADGDLDVVVGNDRQPSYVLINDGRGQFKKSQEIGQATSTRSITLADIDNKNGIDILVTNRGKPNKIFFNDGKGQFKRSKPFGAESDSTIDVAVADLNNDGHNDLVLANRDSQQNYVYFGDSQGKFEKYVKYGTGNDETRGVVVVDFDQDGNLDILNANIGQPNAIYFGDGAGGFGRSVEFGGHAKSYHLQCVQLNRQSKKLAIIVANVGSQNAVYTQNTDGTFSKSLFGIKSGATYNVATAEIEGMIGIATANSDDQNYLFRYIGEEK